MGSSGFGGWARRSILLLYFWTCLSLEGFAGHKASTGLKWAPRDWSFPQWHSELASLHSDLGVCLFLVIKPWNVGFVSFFNNQLPILLSWGWLLFPPSCSVVFRKACVLLFWEMCWLLCENLEFVGALQPRLMLTPVKENYSDLWQRGGGVSVRYGRGQSGTPWLLSPNQITLCARSGSAGAGILVSGPCAIRLPSDNAVLSAEAVLTLSLAWVDIRTLLQKGPAGQSGLLLSAIKEVASAPKWFPWKLRERLEKYFASWGDNCKYLHIAAWNA